MNDDAYDYFDVVIQHDFWVAGCHFFLMTYVNREFVHSENDDEHEPKERA